MVGLCDTEKRNAYKMLVEKFINIDLNILTFILRNWVWMCWQDSSGSREHAIVGHTAINIRVPLKKKRDILTNKLWSAAVAQAV
jgi:hypothetical protein